MSTFGGDGHLTTDSPGASRARQVGSAATRGGGRAAGGLPGGRWMGIVMCFLSEGFHDEFTEHCPVAIGNISNTIYIYNMYII